MTQITRGLLGVMPALMLVAISLTVTGCVEAPVAAAAPTPTVVVPTGDGVLRFGTLLDSSSSSAPAAVAGTEIAVREINAEGGVLAAPVELVNRNRAGDPESALADLVARGVDVVLYDGDWEKDQSATASMQQMATAAGVLVLPIPQGGTEPDGEFTDRLRASDPGLAGYTSGATAYDLTILAALAAISAGDDSGASVGGALPQVTTGAFTCVGFGQCRMALEDLQGITYRGPAGVLAVPSGI